jgi:pectate lyase
MQICEDMFTPRLACRALFVAAVTAILFGGAPAQAETLFVAPRETYKAPSDAARVAKPGDVVKIAPGTYFDCAVWMTDNLTIEGSGPGAVLTDRICQGKAIFVIHADNVTVRNLTFRRARAGDGNGAGIRAEGGNLTVENSRFFNNQSGLMAGDLPNSIITVRNSEFYHNGTCVQSCAHAVYVGHIAQLKIDHSSFFETLVAHHIKSRARSTILTDNHIQDGPDGTASYEIDIPNGGSVVATGNVIEKGPNNQNHKAAIMIGEEGASQPSKELLFKDNQFVNDGPSPFYFLIRTIFVRNLTSSPAQLVGNRLKGWNVKALAGPGTVH